MGKAYTCDSCGGSFTAGWTEEEARAEAEAYFGPTVMSQGPAQVCDDCYRELMAWVAEDPTRAQEPSRG